MANSKIFSFAARFILISLLSAVSIFAAGNVDTTFTGYLGKLGVGRANQTLIQPDGKILVSGNFNFVN